MATISPESAMLTVTLTEEERTHLLSILEQALHDKQIEVRRTDALEFKGHLQHQEALLRGLIDKLQNS